MLIIFASAAVMGLVAWLAWRDGLRRGYRQGVEDTEAGCDRFVEWMGERYRAALEEMQRQYEGGSFERNYRNN